jgi:hypothetical protein
MRRAHAKAGGSIRSAADDELAAVELPVKIAGAESHGRSAVLHGIAGNFKGKTDGSGTGIIRSPVIDVGAPAGAGCDHPEFIKCFPVPIVSQEPEQPRVNAPFLIHHPLRERIYLVTGRGDELDMALEADPNQAVSDGLNHQIQTARLNMPLAPGRTLAADRIDQMMAGQAGDDVFRDRPPVSHPGIIRYQSFDLLAGDPDIIEIQGGMIRAIRSRKIANIHLQNQPPFRISRRLGCGSGNFRGGPFAGWMRFPSGNRAMDHIEDPIRAGGIYGSQQVPLRSGDIQSLTRAGRLGASGVMPLFGNQPEKFARLSALGLEGAAIVRHRNEMLVDKGNDAGIGEDGLTARHTVVSTGSQGMAIHGP